MEWRSPLCSLPALLLHVSLPICVYDRKEKKRRSGKKEKKRPVRRKKTPPMYQERAEGHGRLSVSSAFCFPASSPKFWRRRKEVAWLGEVEGEDASPYCLLLHALEISSPLSMNNLYTL